MHIESMLAFLNQALTTLAMLAAWTATKVDDQLVRVIQVTMRNEELMNLLIEILDEHPEPLALISDGVRGKSVPLGNLVEGELLDSHNEIVATVKAKFEGLSGPEDGKVRAAKDILNREGIDWKKWLEMLPSLILILKMFVAK